jgi:hypothetical protein
MADETLPKEWVLPAEIPFADLKAKDLEECVYWLLDAMGAKDLEWRLGGRGGGAADGGRDLEASFFVPGDDGEVVRRKWWIECKGRAATVEPNEVKSAINNALAFEEVDNLVIATNTQFSNPTRDWVKEWQRKHPEPAVQLWDKAQLERYLSRHPDVVLRLFSKALSLGGRYQAMESRFWNKLEFVPRSALADIWNGRKAIEHTELGMFAVIANEFANGDISKRPWVTTLDEEALLGTLSIGFLNVGYLFLRGSHAGTDQRILIRTYAYLLLAALEVLTPERLESLVVDSLTHGKTDEFPDDIKGMLLLPVIGQLQGEMQDICSADCSRIMILKKSKDVTTDRDEIEDYWLRLEPRGDEEPEDDDRTLRMEQYGAPCNVGFPVDKDTSCPLFELEPDLKNLRQVLATIQRVARFRKSQAAERREKKIAREGRAIGKS